MMFFNGRIIIAFNTFPSECRDSQMLTDSDSKITFSFAIIGSTAATTQQLINNARTWGRCNSVFKCEKVINFALSLENKLDMIVREFFFGYAIFFLCVFGETIYVAINGKAITSSFLGTVLIILFGTSILLENS